MTKDESQAYKYLYNDVKGYGRLSQKEIENIVNAFIAGEEEKDREFKEFLENKKAYYHQKNMGCLDCEEGLLWSGKEDAIELLLLEYFKKG